jgi:hypothetical protein
MKIQATIRNSHESSKHQFRQTGHVLSVYLRPELQVIIIQH